MSASPAKRPAHPSIRDPSSKRPKQNPGAPPSKKDKDKAKAPNPEIELQQSLLSSSPALARLFLESLRSKPASITNQQFARAFWSQRSHLLRAHAVERDQRRAAYNVLSEVKPRNVEGAVRLSITPEQVEDIFRQHPVVRRAYDELVPGRFPDSMAFWAKFFVSRLFKRLKGERITDHDDTDPYLDRYLGVVDWRGLDGRQGGEEEEHTVPRTIDVEGNEANHSQRAGNAPDFTMRPAASDKVPILRVLNSMSERILERAGPVDGGAGSGQKHAPVGILDDETWNELRLRDLGSEEQQERVPLAVRDQNHVSSDEQTSHLSREAQLYARLDPRETLKKLQHNLHTFTVGSSLDLASAIGFAEPSEADASSSSSSSDSDSNPTPKTTNRPSTALRTASSQIQSLILSTSTRESQKHPSKDDSTTTNPLNLPDKINQDLQLTLTTTNEFLSYFWSLLLPCLSSSSSSSAPATRPPPPQDLAALLPTLDNSVTRLRAVGDSAEALRQEKLRDLKRQAAEAEKRLRRKVRLDQGRAGPGRQEVEWLVAPMVREVRVAKERFAGLGFKA